MTIFGVTFSVTMLVAIIGGTAVPFFIPDPHVSWFAGVLFGFPFGFLIGSADARLDKEIKGDK